MWLLGQALWMVGAAWVLLAWSCEQWQPDMVVSLRWWQTGKYVGVAAGVGGLLLASQTIVERALWIVVACLLGIVWYLGRNVSAR